jgi:hypothetical protein
VDSGSAAWTLATEHELILLYGNLKNHGISCKRNIRSQAFAAGSRRLGVSGTGHLVGLAGTLDIKIVDGKHFYTLDYVLPVKE